MNIKASDTNYNLFAKDQANPTKLKQGSNTVLEGCRMRLKFKVGCGIPEILKAKYGMKIGRQGQDMLHLKVG